MSREVLLGDKAVGQLGAWAEHPRLGIIALAVLRNDIDPTSDLIVSGHSATYCSFAIYNLSMRLNSL